MFSAAPFVILATSMFFLATGVYNTVQGLSAPESTGNGWSSAIVLTGAGALLAWITRLLTSGGIVMRNTSEELNAAKEAARIAKEHATEMSAVLKEVHLTNLELVGELAVVREWLFRLGMSTERMPPVARPKPIQGNSGP